MFKPECEAIGTCPHCGGNVFEGKKNFYCENRDCRFTMWKNDHFFENRIKSLHKKDTLAKGEKRIAELDLIIKHLYEDSVTGKLSDERFVKLSREYELEQDNLKSMTDVLRKDLKQQEQKKNNVQSFIAAAKKYTDLTELDATVLREFIDKIYVSKTTGRKGRRKTDEPRKIEIVYNFIGAFDFPKAMEQSKNQSNKKEIGVA